jgi:hypothetical protein
MCTAFLSNHSLIPDGRIQPFSPQQLKGLLTVMQDSESRLKGEVANFTTQLESESRDRETEREAWKENIRNLQEQIEGNFS